MGNKCACSCCQTRPRYKQHVRAAVFNDEIDSLGKFALRTPTQLNDIGRYIKKQIVNNLQNDSRVRNSMRSYSCIIKFCMTDNRNNVLSLMDEYVVECCHLLLLEGFKHNNVDYIYYAMETLKSLLKSVQDRFFAFQRLSDIFDLLIKIGRSEHMESDSYYNGFAIATPTQTTKNGRSKKERQLSYKSDSMNHSAFMRNSANINGFTEKTIVYHALDALKLAVEYSKNQMVETKFTDLMSLFLYNLRPMETTKQILNAHTTLPTNGAGDENNKTSVDIEQIALKGYELLCSHIAGFNNDKLHFTLEEIERDIGRYDAQYVLTLLKTLSKRSRVNGIDIAKAIADIVKYKDISASSEVYKIRPATKMIGILIKYSVYCEKSNRYQIISSLCDCMKWLDDIPVLYQPTVPIYHCQQDREKLYIGDDNKMDTHNFARLQTLQRRVEDTKLSAMNGTSSDGSSASVGNMNQGNEKLSVLFSFANKCLECISVYVSYHDIQSTLSRAILPRLNKSRSFWHKKYLIHAAMETALQKRSSQNKRSCLTPNILRYILQCPFLSNDTMNELHKNELIDLTQLLVQNLSLTPSKHYKRLKKTNSFMTHVLEFEGMLTKQAKLSNEQKPNLSSLDRQSKQWIFAVIYEEITNNNQTNPKPLYMLKSFSVTINILFQSAINEDMLGDDLRYILVLLQSLQKYAISLGNNKEDNTQSINTYSIVIHTWVLSLLFCLTRWFKQSSPATQELLSRLKNIKNQRIQSHQMWGNFLLDEYGLIETVNSMKLKNKLYNNKAISVRDDSIRVPNIFGASGSSVNTTHDYDMSDEMGTVDIAEIEELKLQTEVSSSPTPVVYRQKSQSLPTNDITGGDMNSAETVTHLIPFDKLLPIICKCLSIEDKQEQEQWIKDVANNGKRCKDMFNADYQDLFKSPNVFQRPGFINDNSENISESGDYVSSEMHNRNRLEWDQSSIPSQLYFGLDVFGTPNTLQLQGRNISLKDLFINKELNSNLKQRLRKNILTKKNMQNMNDFYDVIDVYDAQTDHGDNANEIFFKNLQYKINAQLDCQQLRTNGSNMHQSKYKSYGNTDNNNAGIVGIDEEKDEDQKDDPYIMYKTATKTPSLFKITYKPETDLYNSQRDIVSMTKARNNTFDRYDCDAHRYLLIDQELVTNNGEISDILSLAEQQSHTNNANDMSQNSYKGTTILTNEFGYRLGLKQFAFEQGYNSVEYELEGLNFHYVDPNDMMDTAFNYSQHHHHHHHHHHHQHGQGGYAHDESQYGYEYYDSEISEDSDDEQYYNNNNKSRHNQKKKKKKKKFNKQLEKKFNIFKQGFRDKIEDMKQRGAKHAQNDSTDGYNIQLTSFDIKRQQSSPQPSMDPNNINSDIYLRKEQMQRQTGSLTDGDEPLYDQQKEFKAKNRRAYPNAIPSASTTTVINTIATTSSGPHKRGQSLSNSASQSSIFETNNMAGAKHTNNSIIQEEDPEYYQSDNDL